MGRKRIRDQQNLDGSPFEARKVGAAIAARNIARHLDEQFARHPKSWRPLVYCWRGGQRSGSMAIILAQIGWAALVGASAPYLAGLIKESIPDSLEARLMAHAVLGAVLAKSQENSALAGAAGATIGELVATKLFPNKSVDQLTEAERQQISALSTLDGRCRVTTP